MRTRFHLAVTVALMTLAAAASKATAQFTTNPVPDFFLTTASFLSHLPETPVLLVVPDGTGATFAGARLINRQTVDRRIMLWVLDGGGYPIANMPHTAWSLRWQDGGVAACPFGLAPTFYTRADGTTEWIAPPHAGGHSQSLFSIYWQEAQSLTSNTGMRLSINSPDINGDLSVDIADLADFVTDYFGTYNFRSDLSYDGAINIADICVMAASMGRSCP